jgi:hypothetical protein
MHGNRVYNQKQSDKATVTMLTPSSIPAILQLSALLKKMATIKWVVLAKLGTASATMHLALKMLRVHAHKSL